MNFQANPMPAALLYPTRGAASEGARDVRSLPEQPNAKIEWLHAAAQATSGVANASLQAGAMQRLIALHRSSIAELEGLLPQAGSADTVIRSVVRRQRRLLRELGQMAC